MPVFEVDVNFRKKNRAGQIVPDIAKYPFLFADDESDAISTAHHLVKKDYADLVSIDGGDVKLIDNCIVFQDPRSTSYVIAMADGSFAITDGFLTDRITIIDNDNWVRESNQLPISEATHEWIDRYVIHRDLIEKAKKLSDRLSDLKEYSNKEIVPPVAKEASSMIKKLSGYVDMFTMPTITAKIDAIVDALLKPESFSGNDGIPTIANDAISIIKDLCIKLRVQHFLYFVPSVELKYDLNELDAQFQL